MMNNKKNKKNKGLSLNISIILGCVAVVAVIVILAVALIGNNSGGDGDGDETQAPETKQEQSVSDKLTVESIEENGDVMVVTTSYCKFEYPYAFSDLISIKATEADGHKALEFTAEIYGEEISLYTIWFESAKGVPFGTIKHGGETLGMSVEFAEAGETLADDALTTFYATQETFNDVISSLENDSNFSRVD